MACSCRPLQPLTFPMTAEWLNSSSNQQHKDTTCLPSLHPGRPKHSMLRHRMLRLGKVLLQMATLLYLRPGQRLLRRSQQGLLLLRRLLQPCQLKQTVQRLLKMQMEALTLRRCPKLKSSDYAKSCVRVGHDSLNIASSKCLLCLFRLQRCGRVLQSHQ